MTISEQAPPDVAADPISPDTWLADYRAMLCDSTISQDPAVVIVDLLQLVGRAAEIVHQMLAPARIMPPSRLGSMLPADRHPDPWFTGSEPYAPDDPGQAGLVPPGRHETGSGADGPAGVLCDRAAGR